MKVLWLNGWGVGNEALRKLVEERFPNDDHECIDPVRIWKDKAYRHIDDVDWLIGYSTGAFLLLQERELLSLVKNVMLFAPFVDFRKESGLGGKTRKVQLEYLIRWLRKDAIAALEDFYQRAGLRFSLFQDLPVAIDDLVWGIEQLRDVGVSPDSLKEHAIRIGTEDTLIDSKRIAELGSDVVVVEGASHDLSSLLDGWEGLA